MHDFEAEVFAPSATYKGTSKSGALFSPCEKYRYALWRELKGGFAFDGAHEIAFVGLNPSTADESQNDPTVTRCINYARAWGYHQFVMLNAYAYRATDPTDMKAQSEPCGPLNDQVIGEFAERADCIVCAWGNNCERARHNHLIRELRLFTSSPILCLKLTKAGYPGHPLYLKNSVEPFDMPQKEI